MTLTGPTGAAAVELVRDRLAREPGELTPHRVAEALRATGRPVGDADVLQVFETLRRDVVGAGPLEPLLRLPGVTDVLVNGAGQVLLDRGRGLEPSDVRFPDDDAVRRLAQRLAAAGGRRLDDATPYVDLRLADGTRFHAVLSPVARPGTLISLRVPRRQVFTIEELTAGGFLTEQAARLLRSVVSSRLAFLVSGGTGSGKTTLLAALLSLVSPGERVVLVEDSSELRPDHPHLVALEARPANVEGSGGIDLRTLVRQALRMRPDRLVVGEVRVLRGVSRVLSVSSRRDTSARLLCATLRVLATTLAFSLRHSEVPRWVKTPAGPGPRRPTRLRPGAKDPAA
ncbi:TadA family conjugal transfer-associated ATPase [Nocardioides sp.]|uniref:TadA family conjugal transfer-associated ATPase n=1 Tax=Nocardioides sp. TaxID=35761 RepID=UPI002736B31B|nr:TadA family conjugal transfer-associated ATPase [Nocardioides sp.]MDP3890483.1 TadA family conjugal transfer-associated ATPase [Nocardioides sp.]